MMKRKLRMGMIGGGKDAFIGAIYRIAANMDGLIELCCGALSINPEVAKESRRALFLPEERIYLSYQEMLEKESTMPPETRMDFVTIVTPNFAHFAPAMMALEKGFNVVVEKPITLSLEEAKQLQQKLEETGLMLLLTHTYSGYPMVKEARHMIQQGELGKITKVIVEYPQGWMRRMIYNGVNTQQAWRTDPKRSGKSGCMADIGIHAAHLAEYITGLKITEVCAQLNTIADGNVLDDDGDVLLKLEDNAKGVLMASQMASGEENALNIRIYGEKGGIEWAQMEPNSLIVKWIDRSKETIRSGTRYTELLSEDTLHNSRTPGGHPEGYLEAFANLYRNFALTLSAKIEGTTPPKYATDFPSIEDGVRGMAFIDTLVESNNSTEKWTIFKV